MTKFPRALAHPPFQKLPFSLPHGKGARPHAGLAQEQHTSLQSVAALRAS